MIKKTVLLINAGHGGMNYQTGESYTDKEDGKMTLHTNGKPYHWKGWFFEGVSNRRLALEFIAQASRAGYICIPVFPPEGDPEPKQRAELANKIALELQCRCIYLSFHSNAVTSSTSPQNSAQGVCAMVFKRGSNTAKLAEKITLAMQNVFDEYGSKRRAQLIHDNGLDETTHTAMPAILFEIGFFDNPQNADLLMDAEFCVHLIATMVEQIKRNVE
jgi:N-acetylmuramoyl-L-alanine amidase